MVQLSATVIYNSSAFLFPLFSCFRNLTVFYGAFALDQSHVAICLLLTNPIQEHIPAGALKPSGCVDVTYLSWSVPQTPWWLSLNRFSWYKSAELSWDSFISTKNTAQNMEFISHASDCQTASLAGRTIISKRNARNTWKIVLELDFWQPEAGQMLLTSSCPFPGLTDRNKSWFFTLKSFLWLLQRTKQPNQKAAEDKCKIIENLGDYFPQKSRSKLTGHLPWWRVFKEYEFGDKKSKALRSPSSLRRLKNKCRKI